MQIEGAAKGHGSRAKHSQIYPYKFCSALADLLQMHLHKPSYNNDTLLLNDIFDDLFGLEELEEMYAHVTSFVEDEHIHESLVSQPNPPSFEHALVTAALAPVPVKDHLTRKLITLSTSLPWGVRIFIACGA